jgi:serine/threonine protein kinase
MESSVINNSALPTSSLLIGASFENDRELYHGPSRSIIAGHVSPSLTDLNSDTFSFVDGSSYGANFSRQFQQRQYLGKGSDADVYAFENTATGELYARKEVACKEPMDYKDREREFEIEIKITRKLRHHHITSIEHWERDTEKLTFVTFTTPVGEMNLRDFLCGNPSDDDIPLDWFGCLVCAICHAHVNSIKHQDIKPSNIIIKDRRPYLTDFGSERDFKKWESSRSQDPQVVGSPNYLAPEAISGHTRGRQADIFSLGCVFAEMLTVRQGKSLSDFEAHRRKEGVLFPLMFCENLPQVHSWLQRLNCSSQLSQIRDLTIYMLSEREENRPRAIELRKIFRGENLVCESC